MASSVTVPQPHPRCCGKPSDATLKHYADRRTPPRLLGTLQFRVRFEIVSPLTPAPAGNSRPPRARPSLKIAHPRVRGEPLSGQALRHRNKRSPPRVRGEHAPDRMLTAHHRPSTPRPRGTRARPSLNIGYLPLNPRTCGEPGACLITGLLPPRPPPRPRGTLNRVICRKSTCPYTPASAGNTLPQ